jgi:hypothetical protein
VAVISDVGRALRTLLRPHLPSHAVIQLGPPVDASDQGRATDPAVHLVLRWLRDDPNGRQSGDTDVRASDGTLLGRQAPARRYELRYLITARADSVEVEHKLLDAVLLAVAGLDSLPGGCLPKGLADTGLPVFIRVCADPAPNWSVMPAHASFELNVSAPLLPPLQTDLAPPAAELSVGVRRRLPPRQALSPQRPAPPPRQALSPQRPAPPSQPAAPLPQPPAADAPDTTVPTGRQWRRTRVNET